MIGITKYKKIILGSLKLGVINLQMQSQGDFWPARGTDLVAEDPSEDKEPGQQGNLTLYQKIHWRAFEEEMGRCQGKNFPTI